MSDLVPRVHVSFGQRQDMELWNNQFSETKILGLLVSHGVLRNKVDVDAYLMPLKVVFTLGARALVLGHRHKMVLCSHTGYPIC